MSVDFRVFDAPMSARCSYRCVSDVLLAALSSCDALENPRTIKQPQAHFLFLSLSANR